MMRYHVDLSLTRPNDNMPIFSRKFNKSRPNYPRESQLNRRRRRRSGAQYGILNTVSTLGLYTQGGNITSVNWLYSAGLQSSQSWMENW